MDEAKLQPYSEVLKTSYRAYELMMQRRRLVREEEVGCFESRDWDGL
jgi:hypothetical protein